MEALRLEKEDPEHCHHVSEEDGEGQSRPLARLDQSHQDHLPRFQEESITRGARSVRDKQRRKWLPLPAGGPGACGTRGPVGQGPGPPKCCQSCVLR